MKVKELMERIMLGELLRVVEYRSSKPEVISYADRTTREAKTFEKLSHTVETANDSFKVDEDTRKIAGFNAASYKAAFKKGQRVVAVLVSSVIEQGTTEARGHLEPLED